MPGQRQAEELLGIGEPGDRLEAGAGEQGLGAGAVVLGADLGADLVALLEVELEAEGRQADVLPALGAQAHLDPALAGVVEGAVAEGGRVEVAHGAMVGNAQDVAIELGGDAGGVVVGGFQPGDRFHQVDAEQEVIAWRHLAAACRQEVARLLRLEVADRAAKEDDQAPLPAVDGAGPCRAYRPPGAALGGGSRLIYRYRASGPVAVSP